MEILSIGRNNLKKLENLDSVAGTLRQLWISYNNIVGLNGIEKLQNLEVLYMSNNKVHDVKEIERLQALPKLEELLFRNNVFHTRVLSENGGDEKEYRLQIIQRCAQCGARAEWQREGDDPPSCARRLASGRQRTHRSPASAHPSPAVCSLGRRRLPNLKVLDGLRVEDDERTEAQSRA